MSSANRDSFIYSFFFLICMLFSFLALLLWLETLALCCMRMVRMDVLTLFLILGEKHYHSPLSLILSRGSWVAQSGKHLTLDFASGHDLTVCEIEACIRLCTNRAWDSLSLSASPCSQAHMHILSLCLRINKH